MSDVETSTDHHCKACTNLDNSHMVQCDDCEDWYHYVCVGIAADDEYNGFLCFSCEVARAQPVSTHVDAHTTVSQPTQVESSSIPSAAPAIPATQLILENVVPSLTYAPTAAQMPPSTFAPTITHVPLTTVIPPVTTVPPNMLELSNQISRSSLSMSFTMPPSALSMLSNVILPPITRVPSYYPGVFKRTQCFTVPSGGNQLMPSLHYSTPLSSRNTPITSLAEKTTKNTAPALIGNNPSDTKKQGREEVASQRSGSASSRMSRKEKRLQLELQLLDDEWKLQEEEHLKKREYIQKKHNLLMEMTDDSPVEDEGEEYEEDDQALSDKVNQWMQAVSPAEQTLSQHRGSQQHPRHDNVLPQPTMEQHLPSQPIVKQHQPLRQPRMDQHQLLPQLSVKQHQQSSLPTVKQHEQLPQPRLEKNQLPPKPSVKQHQLPPQSTEPQYQQPPQPTRTQYQLPHQSMVEQNQLPPQPSVTQHQLPPQATVPHYQLPPQPTMLQYQLPPQPTMSQYQLPPQPTMTQHQLPPQPSVKQHQRPPQPTMPQYQLPPQPTMQQHHLPTQPMVQPYQLPHQHHLPSQSVPNLRPLRIDDRTQFPSRFENTGGNDDGLNPAQRLTPRQTTLLDDDGYNLSRSQVAARQAVSRELPFFSGIPEEWPLFYSTFITTTNMCGYTSEENLVRLQKCLKGKAYEAVKCRLMHPSNVPGIISTLKMLYGNPEVIVHNLIAKIKTTPPPKSDRLDTLIEFSLAVQNLCATIEACQLDEYSYNVVLLRELVEKLPSSIKVDWAKYRRTLPCVNLIIFSSWLYDLAEAVSPIATLPGVESKAIRGKKDPAYLNAHTEKAEDTHRDPMSTVCVVCKSSCPSVDKCARFAELSYNSHWATVKEFGLCRKCLKQHKASCKSQQVCGKNGCQFKHHQLLHNDHRDNTTSTSAPRQVPTPAAAVQNTTERECNTHLKSTNKTLFRVVPVILYGAERTVKTHAFLDDGSSLTLMDAALAEELKLSGKPEPLCLRWTSNKSRLENDSLRLSIDISGTGENHKKYRLQEVHTVSNLDLFHQSVNMKELNDQYPYLRGIPVESYQDAQPRILIGIDNANLTLPLKGKEGGSCQPIATKTRLGWIVHGGTEPSGELVGYHSLQKCPCDGANDAALQNAVSEYFSIEGIGISKPKHSIASTEDQRAEDILKTITPDQSGHYVSKLLWKYDDFHLPNSKPMALQRLRCLESRLKKDPELAAVLRAKISDYLEKGYIRKLTEEELKETPHRVWYLPIFPVFNPNKPGKVRIVWDAAAKTNGVSLNSMLLTGPDQLASLLSVLIQFRENKVAICGDLREMFHQVWISMEDQHCLRFLWRENPTDAEPSIYVMQVMTFGACCSPSCAQYVKNLNAEKHAGKYPAAAKAIVKNHYVDDMLASTETEDEAIQLAQEVQHIHAQAGFEMRNWISNSPAVLNALQKEHIDEKSLNLGVELTTEKVLGMWWCTATDTLTFKLSPKHDADLLSGKRRPTKREVLRTLMAIFDPLGLLSHLLIFVKVLLQEIWRSGVSWDDKIPENLYEKWEKWLKVLPSVRNVCVPRCYRLLTSIGPETNVQLHTFVDASEDGYAAVAYLRFQQGSSVECAIVAAKSRVAPLKFVSIPRLELQASVIGARLANTVTSSLSFRVDERYFWTDSRDVLCWIRSDHRRYSQFVAFRVSDILETSEIANWRWVGTKDNVADEATKWQRLPDLGSGSRWFKGPEFLWQERDNWPIEPFSTGSTKEEIRPHLLHHSTAEKSCINVEYFSSWKRLVDTVAFVFRFLRNCRSKVTGVQRELGPLSSTELQQASNYLFREAQREAFPEEVSILSSSKATTKAVPKQSTIYTMNPFLDEQQVMRMRGRISRCEYATMDAQNPIILPKDHYTTKLVVRHYHERYHHRNHETVVNEIRQVYRIPKLRVVFRNVRTNCQACKNQSVVPQPPLMGELPKARLAAFSRPFTFVGVDYFGPLTVAVGRRSEKRWGVLVTCLTTRAIHIEVAHTLSADSCVMAIRNFMVRRGVPNQIFSDRGTNFVATNKELKAALAELDQEKIVQEIVSPNTKWCFLPPASPHMGGSWERLIQSVKRNLQQIQPLCLLSDEVLRNLLIEIEGIINSRPLTHVPADDPEAPVLTPNHFILGSSSGLKPATLLDDSAVMLKRSWRTSQVEANIFWQRWVRDYLPDLTKRTKWFSDVKAVEVGDIVVIVDPGNPRNCWPKGRVISVNKGKDNKVRSAAVQTAAGGVYERPVIKLAVLDVRRDEQVSHDSGVPGGECDDPSVGASYSLGQYDTRSNPPSGTTEKHHLTFDD